MTGTGGEGAVGLCIGEAAGDWGVVLRCSGEAAGFLVVLCCTGDAVGVVEANVVLGVWVVDTHGGGTHTNDETVSN